jgi:hypothetical protein
MVQIHDDKLMEGSTPFGLKNQITGKEAVSFDAIFALLPSSFPGRRGGVPKIRPDRSCLRNFDQPYLVGKVTVLI